MNLSPARLIARRALLSASAFSFRQAGFTMIEIAIAVGVIGFALVAIIGILPIGMNTQKDNREDTIISQDAPYFLNAIRNGEMRTNNGIFTNYVESISITNNNGTGAVTGFTVSNPAFATNNDLLTNDAAVVGFLSTPEFVVPTTKRSGFGTNTVTAIVRAMTGSAMQQNGLNSATAFRYQLTVEIVPWNLPEYPFNPGLTLDQLNYLESTLHEIRLKFAWPVLPSGSIGPNRQTYRSLISGNLTNFGGLNSYWYFQPLAFAANTNQ